MKLFGTLPMFAAIATAAIAQEIKRDIPDACPSHERQVLDVYSSKEAKRLPVIVWIHGGGLQTGDKSGVLLKPQTLMDKVFV